MIMMSWLMVMVRGGSVGDDGVVVDGDGTGGSVGDNGVVIDADGTWWECR